MSAAIKIALQMSPDPSPADLRFAQQLGVRYVVLWTSGDKVGYDYYASRRDLFGEAGITVYGFGNRDVHNQDAVVLDLPGRDAKVEQYKQHLRDLGRAGIPYTTYAHMANGVWSSSAETTRGGARARACDMCADVVGHWNGVRYRGELTHGRRYSEQEIWDNYASFIQEVAPVAEEAGVKIGIHPDDPPVDELGGVPRCIFSTFSGYCRALEIADSPNVGVCLCVGCWLEGGDRMGCDVLQAIRLLAEQDKLFKIHFRNVDRPLPHFVETFLNDGYMDMTLVMRGLHEARFDGVVIPDHIPRMDGGGRVGAAYTIGYMQALMSAVARPN